MDRKDFLFSVVVPVFNSESYLSECLDSVISQSVGFEDKVQLILVDDESTDGSLSLCREYEEKYPLNIKVISKGNGGPGSAKNAGKRQVSGQLVMFLDSDDKISEDALSEVKREFDKYGYDIDIVDIRIRNFGSSNNYTRLDWIFDSNRLIDIEREPEAVSILNASAVYRVEAVRDVSFDETIKIAEDVKFFTSVLLQKKKYGIVSNALYYYRRREDGISLTQAGIKNIKDYTEGMKHSLIWLCRHSIDMFGETIPYIQNLALSQANYRVMDYENKSGSGDNDVDRSFVESMRYLLSFVDDDRILGSEGVRFSRKILLYHIKYGSKSRMPEAVSNGGIEIRGKRIKDEDSETIKILKIDADEGILNVKLTFNTLILEENTEILVRLNGELLSSEDRRVSFHKKISILSFFDYKVDILGIHEMEISIPLRHITELSFGLRLGNKEVIRKLKFDYLAKLYPKRPSYFRCGNRIISCNDDYSGIKVQTYPWFKILRKEYNNIKYIKEKLNDRDRYRLFLYALLTQGFSGNKIIVYDYENIKDSLEGEEYLPRHTSKVFFFTGREDREFCRSYIRAGKVFSGRDILRNHKFLGDDYKYFKRFFRFDVVYVK